MAESNKSKFVVKGNVKLTEFDGTLEEIPLMASVFDVHGQLLGTGPVNDKGTFEISLRLYRPSAIELMVGPSGDIQNVRNSSAFSQRFQAEEWKQERNLYLLKPELIIRPLIWKPWWPLRICVSGHVRKIRHEGGSTLTCPVPFVKVEIFDVDREFCLWPYIKRWWDVLVDRPLIRLPELLKPRPIIKKPFPIPDPIGPVSFDQADLQISAAYRPAINPQPEPPGGYAYLGPQPIPPGRETSNVNLSATSQLDSVSARVGESRLLTSELASRFDKLTVVHKIAPWLIFPKCFYSKKLVCETTTDETGYFRCCFHWWPFQFRFGRLRFDARPDIIIRVTQVIDGVETVIYMDPYTSTRWNVTHTHIDLWLDDEEIVCGGGDKQDRPEGSQAFFTRIGDDEVHDIDSTTGLYNGTLYTNVAYGHSLLVYAQFGDNLSDASPLRYYRLSYAKQGSPDAAFVPITVPLTDYRVDKVTNLKDSEYLGPVTVNDSAALYKIRNFADYLWYNPDKIGTWYSWLAEPDTGLYILRMEVFDENGQKLDSSIVEYLDGRVPIGDPLSKMKDRCDLLITLDNKPPELQLTPPTTSPCGVIPWTAVPPLNFQVKVSQDNNRLHHWYLTYTKGTSPLEPVLAFDSSNAGLTAPVNETIDGAASPTGLNMLDGVDSTCAFALELKAKPHIRNGRYFVYYRETTIAIAIEKCVCEDA